MISVLIPLKDWNPFELASGLAAQLEESGIPWEIIVSDDSDDHGGNIHRIACSAIPNLTWHSRKSPLGRSANRNFLASLARGEYLLFIDGDAGIAGSGFISKYAVLMGQGRVLCGGTLYQESPPSDPQCLLRWTYGRKREQVPASLRNRKPWDRFSTFNFLIPKDIFMSIGFDESISGYGHEDTLLGLRLREAGIPVLHLDNGLFHLGLDNAAEYLVKVKNSVKNLNRLAGNRQMGEKGPPPIRLLKTWNRLRRAGLVPLFRYWFRLNEGRIERQLSGTAPSLLLLDIYKLGLLSQIH